LVISQIGFSTAYIIFIAANISSLDPSIPLVAICLACVPVLAFLVQAKEMKTLSPFSLLADVANLAGLSAVLFQDYEHYKHNDDIHTFEWSSLYYVIAISVYSLEGVGLILSLESSCQNRAAFPKLLKSVIFGLTVLMCFFGTAGYLAFGDQTLAPITLNLSHAGGEFVKISLCLALYFTYPIMMFPVHSVLEGLNTSGNRLVPIPIIRALLVVLTACIAYLVPDFGKFLSLVGSSICTLLGFIFPCYFHLATFEMEELKWWQSMLDILLIIGGIGFGIIGTYHSFLDLFESDDVVVGGEL
jgi:proton-coupled amino acid transporter